MFGQYNPLSVSQGSRGHWVVRVTEVPRTRRGRVRCATSRMLRISTPMTSVSSRGRHTSTLLNTNAIIRIPQPTNQLNEPALKGSGNLGS